MLKNVFLKTLRDQSGSIFWWSTGFVFLSIYLSWFYPYISRNAEIFKMVEALPPVIKDLIGDIDFAATPAGFFNLQPFSFFAPILILFYSVSKGVGAVAGEKENGTLDLLLSKPLPRSRVIIQKILSLSAGLAIIHVFFYLGMIFGVTLFQINLNPARLAAAVTALYFLSLSFLTISAAAGVILLDRKKAVGAVSGFALISFIINAYAPTMKLFQIARAFSPFYYNSGNSPIQNGLDFRLLLTQILIAAFFLFLAVTVFNKRDLYS